MATEVVMPKQGNTVESCIILEWKVAEGDTVEVGTIVCEAETDKSTIEVESTAQGTVLKLLYEVGSDVPVMQPILIVGEKGEKVELPAQKTDQITKSTPVAPEPAKTATTAAPTFNSSPRSRQVALELGVNLADVSPTGPQGRIIEKDVRSAAPLTPVAQELMSKGDVSAPSIGSGIGQRVLGSDLLPLQAKEAISRTELKGIRKITAERMHQSLAQTAQFTMTSYAEATGLLALRQKFKQSDERLGLQKITINDIILFVVSRTLEAFPFMNGHFVGDAVEEYADVHLGCAVDTPRGLLVPVIRHANQRSLKGISDEFKRLAAKAQPDDLTGSTFTVTNLGALGIEAFTPVVNIPEIAILGVGSIALRATEDDQEEFVFSPHIALSLTVDHQAVDGAPAARFLQALCVNIANVEMVLAL
ncbi:MAG: dihydrolipoamide acetyltransferase family protein [Sphaerochaetaceae bacterium]